MEIYLTGALLIFSGGIISLLFDEKLKSCINCAAGLAGSILISYCCTSVILTGSAISFIANFSYPVGTVSLYIDPLSSFFSIIIALMSFLCSVYNIFYMGSHTGAQKPKASYYTAIPLFITSMLLVVIVNSALAFLIVWELMSLSSAYLVFFENDKEESRNAALYYIVAMHIGTACLISAFIISGINSPGMDFSDIALFIKSGSMPCSIIIILFFTGFGTKAGFIPFHTWLPKAHPAAPAPVSAMMSGIMINIGIYGLLRVISWLDSVPFWLILLFIITGLVTAVTGIIYSTVQNDIKKSLAYSSIENMGISAAGIGFGLAGKFLSIPFMEYTGFAGAVLHLLNHSLYKSLLFMGSGNIYKSTHTRDIEDLGGLSLSMPFTSGLFLAGSAAISGLPPLNGFASELLIFMSIFSGIGSGNLVITVISIFSIAGLSLAGGLACLSFTRLYGIIFKGKARGISLRKIKESGPAAIIPMALILAAILAIGIFPGQSVYLLKNTLMQICGLTAPGPVAADITAKLSFITILSLTLIILTGLLLILRNLLGSFSGTSVVKTWDCGFGTSNSRLQYTGSSFSQIIVDMSGMLVRNRKKSDFPYSIFPRDGTFSVEYEDWIDFIIKFPVKLITAFLDKFSWIQNGYTQQYILYGLLFLIISVSIIIGAGM